MLEIIHQTLAQPSLDSGVGESLGVWLGNGLGKELTANQKAIIQLIQAEPRITVKVMAARLGLSTTAIENNLKKLREWQLVQRIGGRRDGYWQAVGLS